MEVGERRRRAQRLTRVVLLASLVMLAGLPLTVLAVPWMPVWLAAVLEVTVLNLVIWGAVLLCGLYRNAWAMVRVVGLLQRRVMPRRGLAAAHFTL